MESYRTLTIPPDLAGIRIDRAIAHLIPEYSRTFIQRLIDTGSILINSRSVDKSHTLVAPYATITIQLPLQPSYDTHRLDADAVKNYGITIVAEHDEFIIINKPAGILVHRAGSAPHIPTVTDWLISYYPHAISIGDHTRPGIIHRLDKDTSGLLVIAKDPRAYVTFSRLFADRAIRKTYRALVVGTPPATGAIDFNIMRHPKERIRMTHSRQYGKSAYTDYQTIAPYPTATLIELYPKTGRTHQLRVHCAAIGFPIVGDTLYGAPVSPFIARQALHAYGLSFIYSGQEHTYTAPIPVDFINAIEQFSLPLIDARYE